ncbi:hypothetical protein [Streptomyces broussonetiae]|uniref:PIN domain-containing protein n=1 Tax=Streptomyces broussonetiae TaxID=2686304 RepID=A0ABV5EKV9_9ACTN
MKAAQRQVERDNLGELIADFDEAHKYATDAMLCATALRHPGRVTILTSDGEDIGLRTVEDIGLRTAEHPRLNAEKV